MSTYVILTRFTPQTETRPEQFRKLADEVESRVKRECPDLEWKQSFSTSGSRDVVDIVESDDPSQVQRAAMLIRAMASAETETLAAVPWKQFLRTG